jgi:hypothetical protein
VPEADIHHERRLYVLLHGRTLHISANDKWAAVELSEVGDGHIEIEQAKVTNDELSDARLLRDAADDCRCCM